MKLENKKNSVRIPVQLQDRAFLATGKETQPVLHKPGDIVWIDRERLVPSMIQLDEHLKPLDPSQIPENPMEKILKMNEGSEDNVDVMAKALKGDTEIPGSSEVNPAKDGKLSVALGKLDNSNDDQWTKEGLPEIKTLRELTGLPVSRSDVERVAPDLRRAE